MAPLTLWEIEMQARYIGSGVGNWKGLDIAPGRVLDIPERLQDIVANNANFEIVGSADAEPSEAPRRRGRPRKEQ